MSCQFTHGPVGRRGAGLLAGPLTLLAILAAGSAAAQSAPTPGGASAAEQLDEVVVTATRVAQPLASALEPVIVIEREALADSLAVDVGDVLRQHAGLDVARSGGPGQPVSLFIRGANSDQSIIMIDGVRINSGTQALAPLLAISPELFERIEIVKGPRSAIYGTDAIGGVVNLLTRAGGPSGADALLSYGRYGTGEYALDGRIANAASYAQGAISAQSASGLPVFAADTQDRGYRNVTATAALGTHIDGLELAARVWQASGTSYYANPICNSFCTAYVGYTPLSEGFTNRLLTAHVSGELSGIWHARLALSRVSDDLHQQQTDPYSLPPAADFDLTRRDSIELQNDVRLASASLSQLLTFGATLTNEQTRSASFGTDYAIATPTQTYYLQDQLSAGPSRLLLAGGFAHHPAFGDHATGNAEYGYALRSNALLTASIGTAFHAPTATDRFGFGGTPQLLPESSRNVELGIKLGSAAHQQFTFAAFSDTIDNLIVFVNDASNLLYFGENRNVDRARIRGLEASWDWRDGPWAVHAEASAQDPRNLVDGTGLLRRSRRSFTLSAARTLTRAELGLDLLLAGPRPDVDVLTFLPVQDGGYLLASARGKFDLSDSWQLTGRIDNALNRRYQQVNGYNTPGVALTLATRYRFR